MGISYLGDVQVVISEGHRVNNVVPEGGETARVLVLVL
jgi:hypothetical protein